MAEMAEHDEDLMLGEEEEDEEEVQMPDEAVIPEVPMPQEVTDGVDGYFCKHYKRKCMFVVSSDSSNFQFLIEEFADVVCVKLPNKKLKFCSGHETALSMIMAFVLGP